MFSAVNSGLAPPRPRRAGGGNSVLRMLGGRPYTIATVTTLGIMAIGAIAKRGAAWNQVYVGAARMLLQGRDFYREIGNYAYPPFSALASIPFTLPPPALARGIWYLICVASTIYLMRKAWRLAGGTRVEGGRSAAAAGRREQIAFLLGHAIALQFALNALSHLQTDLLIGALIMAGCGLILAGRFYCSAIWIGLAAAFKATPLLFAPYLMWRRQWMAAALLVSIAIGANLLPNAVRQPPGGGLWLTRWCQQYLEPMTSENYLPGNWKNQLNNNQSIAGAVRRWLGTSWGIVPGDFKVFDRPNAPGSATIRGAFYLACVAVLLPVAWVAWRRRTIEMEGPDLSAAPATAPPDALPDPRAIECGIVLLLMVLLSPNSSVAHFCVLYLPAFCIARLAVLTRALALRVLLALAVVFSIASIHIRIGATMAAEQILLWLGVITFATLMLLIASVLTLLDVKVTGDQCVGLRGNLP